MTITGTTAQAAETTTAVAAVGTTSTETDASKADADNPRQSHRQGLSVRTRIIVALAVLVAIALTSAGLIIYALEGARLKASAVSEAEQELAEFAEMQSSENFTEIDPLLNTFLTRNVPNDYEMLVGWIDGSPRYRSGQHHTKLTDDPQFRADVEDAMSGSNASHIVNSPYGDLLLTVQPVATTTNPAPADQGALVVVTFLDDARGELTSLLRTYAIVGLLSLGAITALAAWQAGRLLAPLRRLNDTAREISSSDLSSRIPETGNDDITDLTRTLNQMLNRLESSFGEQRRFLDDAGHELRTPLTVLRGHLELLQPDNPTDVAETRALLLDEVDRMSRLVEDMTLLAKSGRPDFLNLEDVDLEQLTRAAYAKAVALGDRVWKLDEAGTAKMLVDPQRVTQAVLQLADNAVKHTDPGDEIAIGSDVSDGHARLWVRDSGDGVALEARSLIFERFERADVRSGDEGFGLGLSIVRAIAVAHGGDVTVGDVEPHGADFTLILPLDAQPETLWPDS